MNGIKSAVKSLGGRTMPVFSTKHLIDTFFTHFPRLIIFSPVRFLRWICDDFPLQVEGCMNRRKDKARTRAAGSVAAGLGYLHNTYLEFRRPYT